jgi:cytoskeletal protein RodZ
MAKEFLIHEGPAKAKMRNPIAVLLLAIVTLGLYAVWWWYSINWELSDLGEARDVDLGQNPILSAAAWMLGGLLLYVPTVWTITATTKRIQKAQRLVGASEEISGWIALVLWIFTLGVGAIIYTQWGMNRIWETQPIVKYLTQEEYRNLPDNAERVRSEPAGRSPANHEMDSAEAEAVLARSKKEREVQEAEEVLRKIRESD